MALTQISTEGIKNGTITGADLATNVDLVDDQKLRIGTGNDLQIFHDPSSGSGLNLIKAISGFMIIQQQGNGSSITLAATNVYLKNHVNNETFLHAVNNGAVSLYHDNVKTFFTTSAGIQVQGPSGGAGQITLSADANEDNADKFKLVVEDNGPLKIQNRASGSWETNIECNGNGNVELYHNDLKKLETYNQGVSISGNLVASGTIYANTNLEINNVAPQIFLVDSNNNSDFAVQNSNGSFIVRDTTNSSNRFTIDSTGNIAVSGTVDGRDLATDGAKLDTIESNATADQTASEILTLLKTVDGSGSGLDADTLDGVQASALVAVGGDTMTGGLRIDKGNSADGIMGEAYNTYFGLKHTDQTLNSEYMIISRNDDTFISASSTHKVRIRSGGNDSTNELSVGSGNDALTWRGNKIFHAGNDGSGSGLDADTLQGASPSVSAGNNTIVKRHSSGYIFANYFNTTPNDVSSGITKICVETSNDGYIRHGTAAGVRTFLNVENGATADQTAADIRGLGFFDTSNDGSGSGLDSDTVDGIHGASFARSDQDDTMSGSITLSKDATDVINFSANASSDNRGIAFNQRTALSADYNDGYLRLNNNSEFSNGVYTPGVLRVDGDLDVRGGAGAITVQGNSDISFINGSTWSGNHTKIAHHGTILYIVGGAGGIAFRESGTNRAFIDGDGHFKPGTNNTYDLGTSSTRWRNVYTNDLNLSNEGGSNDVDSTWGSYTIQEGAEDLFLINRRNGKKYKFNLTEV